MRKNLAVDVPRDAETEVDRIRGLKKSIFTRTRIATLCLVMVVALSVTGTLAFEKYSGNATANRGWMSYVTIKIGEQGTGKYYYPDKDEEQEFIFGKDNKKVKLELNTTDTEDKDLSYDVTMSFVPEVASKAYQNTLGQTLDDGWVAFNEYWMEGVKTDSSGRQYIETQIMLLYLADGWNDEWIYQAGVFKSKEPFKNGTVTGNLLSGVVLKSEILKSDYNGYRLEVIAQAVKHVDTEDDDA